jgi:hypothetical protein
MRARSLVNLLDAVAATLASFLDPPALRAVIWSIRDAPPPLAEAFQLHVQLRIPPDATRKRFLVQLIQSHHAAAQDLTPTPQLPIHFAVADTDEAAALVCVASHVRGLTIASNEYMAWPERPFRWDLLRHSLAFERLEIDQVWDRPLDLASAARARDQERKACHEPPRWPDEAARAASRRYEDRFIHDCRGPPESPLSDAADHSGQAQLASRRRVSRRDCTAHSVGGPWYMGALSSRCDGETLREYGELYETWTDSWNWDVHPA